MSVAIRVIPCLDVDNGRVVKGVNFEGLRDAGDPVELAARYGRAGADELTFLDVTASSGDRATVFDVVARTADQVFIPLTVGGGVRAVEDVDKLLRAGADKASINTAAVVRPDVINAITQRSGSPVRALSLAAHVEADRVEYNTVRPHENLSWNRPIEVHLGLADPTTPNFPEPQNLPTT